MLARHFAPRKLLSCRHIRSFSLSHTCLVNLESLKSINDTINHLNQNTTKTDPDLKNHQTYLNLINHHANKLDDLSPEQIDKEYSDIYTLSLQLSKLLESTPEVTEDFKKQILNTLIERFTKHNYAVSTLAFKKLLNEKSNLSSDSINQLIVHNPGRVNSSWDLYHSLKNDCSDDTILISVLKKLLYGDQVEIKEGLQKIDVDKLSKIFQVYKEIVNKDLIGAETLTQLIKDIIKLECTPLITKMSIPSNIIESLILSNNEDKDFELRNIDYLYFYEASINNGVSLSGNALLKSFMPISKLQLSLPMIESENMKKIKELLDIQIDELASVTEIVEEIRYEIQESQLDDTPEVMINLIKSAEFHSKDIKTAMSYFQTYQTKIPEGTVKQNDLKSTMSLAFVYECIDKNDKKLVNVAETLVPQSPLPAANNLAALIMFHGWFANTDKSFDIYNQALTLFLEPHEGNEANRGVLVESLAIVCLLGKEIGLANLIKQKSLENKLINDFFEIRLTNLFKEYGDKIEECKDDGMFREEMKKIVLRTIIEISP